MRDGPIRQPGADARRLAWHADTDSLAGEIEQLTAVLGGLEAIIQRLSSLAADIENAAPGTLENRSS